MGETKVIGIVGYGYVGQATHELIEEADIILDANSKPEEWDKARNCDFIFICVPTPSACDGSCDTSTIEGAMKRLGTDPLYVIRSTVPWSWHPGKEYKVVAMPEFLSQNRFLEPQDRPQLLGGEYRHLQPLLGLLATLGIDYRCTTWEAAWQTKYASNMYGAFKVLFWEMIQDITGNERLIYDLWSALDINQGDMAQVGMDGQRGFGGACFPKDVKAIAAMTQHPLLKAVVQYNEELKNGKQVTEDQLR